MSVFVLVHGGWHGAWCWERLVPPLRAAGHSAIAPDLPAHGQAPLRWDARPYELYVPRIRAIVRGQREPVILVGHSSGGATISEVAVHEPGAIGALVYLTAFLLPRDVPPPAIMRDDTESLLAASLVADEGQQTVRVRPDRAREVFYSHCTDGDAAWAIARLQSEPIMPREQAAPAPIAAPSPPRIYIETLHDKALGPMTQQRMYTAMPCERVYAVPTDHSPFLSAPGALASILAEIAERYAVSTAP